MVGLIKIVSFFIFLSFFFPLKSLTQHQHDRPLSTLPVFSEVEPQPLLAQAIRLNEALSFLGSSLSKDDAKRLKELQDKPLTQETSKHIQAILDPYCLAIVDINPEARVKVIRGPAEARLIQNGWTSYLIKVHNEARLTAQLQAESPNAGPLLHGSAFPPQPHASPDHLLTPGHVANCFLEVQMFHNRPLLSNLSGLIWNMQRCRSFLRTPGNVRLKSVST